MRLVAALRHFVPVLDRECVRHAKQAGASGCLPGPRRRDKVTSERGVRPEHGRL